MPRCTGPGADRSGYRRAIPVGETLLAVPMTRRRAPRPGRAV